MLEGHHKKLLIIGVFGVRLVRGLCYAIIFRYGSRRSQVWYLTIIVIINAIFMKNGRKNFLSNGTFFTRCLLIALTMLVHVSEFTKL